MKVASDNGAAQAAVSKFSAVSVDATAQASAGASQITGMSAGVAVANQMLDGVSALVGSAQADSGRVTKFAAAVEGRDSQDSGEWFGF